MYRCVGSFKNDSEGINIWLRKYGKFLIHWTFIGGWKVEIISVDKDVIFLFWVLWGD